MKIHALFLDDNKFRHQGFRDNNRDLLRTHVYNADDCIEKLVDEDQHYDIILLDHDLNEKTNNQLNDDEKDGRYVAKRMTNPDIATRYRTKIVLIHSLNRRGAEEMRMTLMDSGYERVYLQPFIWEVNISEHLSKWL